MGRFRGSGLARCCLRGSGLARRLPRQRALRSFTRDRSHRGDVQRGCGPLPDCRPLRGGKLSPMWIVRLALRRPFTVAVFCLVVLLLGALSAAAMAVDIFPAIDIPVVIVVWNYPGLSAEDMERRVTFSANARCRRRLADLAHRLAVDRRHRLLRVYFEQDADLGSAIAQIASSSLAASRVMPPGITPPVVLQYNASNVTVAQMTLSGTASESELFDWASTSCASGSSRFPACRRRRPTAESSAGRGRRRPDPERRRTASRRKRSSPRSSRRTPSFRPARPASATRRTTCSSTAAPTTVDSSTSSRSASSTAPPCSCGTSPTSTTGSRCRRTWSASMASGRRSSPSSRSRTPRRWRSSTRPESSCRRCKRSRRRGSS